jgi:RNA polymerase sigma factor (TIGR02999 family)
MNDITRILSAIDEGAPHASDDLLPLVYAELRQLAAQRLAQERPGQTLQATALVHEAYLRLVGSGPDHRNWSGRNHFFAAAAEAMRRILIESARRKNAGKRRGGQRLSLDDVEFASPSGGPDQHDLLALDEAISRLAEEDLAKAELVKLRFFAGLTIEEAAGVLGISRATAARHWDYARSWLYTELRDGEPANDGREVAND